MQRILKLDRLRLRGLIGALTGAKDEVLLTAMAQNLRKARKVPLSGPPLANACVA